MTVSVSTSTDKLSPSLVGQVKGTCVFRTFHCIIILHTFPFQYSICPTSGAALLVVLYISVGGILKTINTQSRLVPTLVFHLLPTALAIVYVFGRWFTPVYKMKVSKPFTILLNKLKKIRTNQFIIHCSVPETRLELVRPNGHSILSAACLPFHHSGN